MIEKLQYITQDHPKKSHSDLCYEACEAGVKWIQLRIKNQSDSVYLEQAKICRQITRDYNATLIINDRIDIALEIDADGVHLGQEDTDTDLARKAVKEKIIIGGTANTLEQVKQHIVNKVNYIGLGPFCFTQTKKKLSPVLGLQGYQNIISNLTTETPIIAVGGINLRDIINLYEIGVYGIAVSSLISESSNKKKLVRKIREFW